AGDACRVRGIEWFGHGCFLFLWGPGCLLQVQQSAVVIELVGEPAVVRGPGDRVLLGGGRRRGHVDMWTSVCPRRFCRSGAVFVVWTSTSGWGGVLSTSIARQMISLESK